MIFLRFLILAILFSAFGAAGADTSYVTGQSVVSTKSYTTAWYGYKFTTGPTNTPTVTSLGRYVYSGNTGTHTVEIVKVSTGAVVASASVATSGVTAGTYAYTALGTSVTLTANTAYYIAAQESSTDLVVIASMSSTSTAMVNASVSSTNGTTWSEVTGPNIYGPVNFLYTGGAPTAVPSAPTGVAYGANGRAELTWNAMGGADSYNVYRSTTSGSGYSKLNSSALYGTAYDDSTASNGTQYYYVVTAVNVVGESSNSAQVSAIPGLPPPGSTGFITSQSVVSTHTYTTSWYGYKFTTGSGSPPTVTSLGRYVYSGNSGLHSIVIYNISTSSVVATAEVATSGVTAGTYAYANLPTPVTLAASTSYYIADQESASDLTVIASYGNSAVATVNGSASSQNAVTWNFVSGGNIYGPVDFQYTLPPGTPTGLTATASQVTGAPRVTLNWGTVTGIATYSVYRGTSAGGESTTPVATGIATNSYTDTAVSNATHYYYKVTAVNASGESAKSGEADATTAPGAAPGSPFAQGGSTGYTLTWTASATATSYKVYRGFQTEGEGGTPYATGVSSGYVDTAPYTTSISAYRISAVNAGGEGPLSDECVCGPPPTRLVAQTAYGPYPDGAIGLDFGTALSDSYGSKVYRGTSSGAETFLEFAYGGSYGGYVNIPPSQATYYYRSAFLFPNGASALGNEVAASPNSTWLAAPVLSGSVNGSGQNVLSWTAVPGAASYDLYRYTVPFQTGLTGTTYTDTTGTSSAYYKVVAVGAGGIGDFSNTYWSAASFSMSIGPSPVSVARGGQATTVVNFTPSGNFDLPIALAVTSTLPSGITCSFYPATCDSHGSNLTVAVDSGVSAGTYGPYTVTATAGALTATATFSVTVP